MNQFLFTTYNNKNLAILLENGNPAEIFAENPTTPPLVGNIYLGVVVRVLKESKIAFVDIGEHRTALLHFNDCHKTPTQGEKLLVQAIKDPINDKGARLTTKIRLISQNLIFLPTEKVSLNISKKITDLKVREYLTNQLKDKLNGGLIVRTNAQYCDDFTNEINELKNLWDKLLKEKQENYKNKTPQLLYSELSLFLRIIRDKVNFDDKIIVENDRIVQEIFNYFPKLNLIKNDNLQSDFNIEQIIKNALSDTVHLPSGGYLIIDEIEAMTVIDVNAGTSNNPILSNNEAVIAIANTIRLKNIGGIIVIDFIDMPKSAQTAIINDLKSALKKDSVATQVYSFSQLGLLEMTRERVYLPLSKILNDHSS